MAARVNVAGALAFPLMSKWRTVEVRACPVMFRPDARQIEGARRAYGEWWQALGWVREGLQAGSLLHELEVTKVMPRERPWVR